MRRDGLHRLAVVVVHAELFLLVDGIQGFLADDHALIEHELAQGLAQVGVLADGLGDDVAGAFQGILDGSYFLFWIDERGSVIADGLSTGLLSPKIVGEGLEAAIASDRGFGPPLRTVRKVEIFQLGLVEGGLDAGLELVAELALLKDRAKDSFATADELSKVAELVFDVADLYLVEIAGRLFAIACDEGNGAPFVEQSDDRGE